MNKATVKKIVIAAGIILLIKSVTDMFALISSILQTFFIKWEGFIDHPKWDYQQWSWGYGSRVPGSTNDPTRNPGGTINRVQAMQEALKHVLADYNYLKGYVTAKLKPMQWAMLLSFSYNEGAGAAIKLVPQINAGDLANLETHWKQYIYAGGVINDDLVDRRNAEWANFVS